MARCALGRHGIARASNVCPIPRFRLAVFPLRRCGSAF